MTKANFREGHPNVPWNPNLIGHQQKHVGRKVYDSLQVRTKAIQDEIFNKKTEPETETALPNS